MKTRLHRLIGLGILADDDPDTRLKKVALTLVPLIIGPAAFIWGLIYFWLGHPRSGAIPMSYAIISAGSLVYYLRTQRTGFLQNSQLVLVLVLPYLLMWSLGGFAAGSMVMLWAIFTPVAALMFMDKRAAAAWFGGYLVLLLISGLIDERVAAATVPLPDLARAIFYLLNVGCVSAGLYLLVSSSINEEKRAIAQLLQAQKEILASRENMEQRVFERTRELQENEATLRQLADELRLSASVFTNSSEGVLITDAAFNILLVNPAFSEITGYSAQDVMGKEPGFLQSERQPPSFYRAMRQQLRQEGAWRGELWHRHKSGEDRLGWVAINTIRDAAGTAVRYVALFHDITEERRKDEHIRQLAFYDALTNLPNRRMLLDRLRIALSQEGRSRQKGALVFLDLDNFKRINDSLGHAYGDLLLQEVARRLSASLRAGDTVARLGGDEFVVMLCDLGRDVAAAAHKADAAGKKILETLSAPYELGHYTSRCTPSIGIALFGGADDTLEDVLRRADLAMYQAKAAGRNAIRFFDPELQLITAARGELEAALSEGVRSGQIFVVYQAQVDSRGTVTGAEVLARWQHPQRGLVPPSEFIPLAEQTGLIVPLGNQVLEMACRQLRHWAKQPQTAHLTLAVNISAHQFLDANFLDLFVAVLEMTGADPRRLKLEVTESLLVENVASVIDKMRRLKDMGVGLSIDDFGTGYSSLSYLKKLPLDQLKVDQTFVRDMLTDRNDAEIVRTIIALAQGLGLSVIAEGVESPGQLAALAEYGCQAYQGYLFGRPVPIEEFETRLAAAQNA